MPTPKPLTATQHALAGMLRWLFTVLSRLPLRVLYGLSDVLYVLVCHVARYRRSIVHRNMHDAYPQLTAAELRTLERRFYRWFCDYMVETVKLTTIGPDEMRRRMRFEHTEVLEQLVGEGRSVVLMLGHYCNWEWVSTIPLHTHIPAEAWMPMQLYHPLENAAVDALFLGIRSRHGVNNVAMRHTLRAMVTAQRDGRPFVAGFIADQVPLWSDIHLWTPFLRHTETPFFTGGERLAKRFNTAVVYLDLRRESRGHYVAAYRLVTRQPDTWPDYTLTEDYARRLEQTIDRDPACWLWTHNRWKRTREEYDRRLREWGHV